MIPVFLKHRTNAIASLEKVDPLWGVEIDLRSEQTKQKLILSHDPWQSGDAFEDWLCEFKRRKIAGPIALNTKEDGLEDAILEALQRHKVADFFFVDTPFPTLHRWVHKKRAPFFAIRVSRFESPSAAMQFRDVAQWVWLDSFDGLPMDLASISELKAHFKICLVSPELHGTPEAAIEEFVTLGAHCDGICTKFPAAWEREALLNPSRYINPASEHLRTPKP